MEKHVLNVILLSVIICNYSFAQTIGKYRTSTHEFNLPGIIMIDQNNTKVSVREMLSGKNVVILDFIYTTCRTVCPVMSTNYANFQNRMLKTKENFRLVSVTVDPSRDSTEVMKKYLSRYRAADGWSFLTGSEENIMTMVKIFSAYINGKMGFDPVVFLYNPHNRKWVQIEGRITADELSMEYMKIASSKKEFD